MPKPVSEWTEDDVLALPPGENDSFERKGAKAVDLTLGIKPDDVSNELAKQISAFANTGGGQIIYGVDDFGKVDNGGIARVIKGRQSTKEWLEDVIPKLTEYEIVGFNVQEVPPKESESALAPDKSLYVVDVPDSERAPHQSTRDKKYYVRLAGKSHPAPHRLIEDIRNRARHPKIEITHLHVVHGKYLGDPNIPGAKIHFNLRIRLRNTGRIRAANVALLIGGNVAIDTTDRDSSEYFRRFGSSDGTVFVELKNSFFPEMELTIYISFLVEGSIQPPRPDAIHGAVLVGGKAITDVNLVFTCFADSSPTRSQEFRLSEADYDHKLNSFLGEQLRRLR